MLVSTNTLDIARFPLARVGFFLSPGSNRLTVGNFIAIQPIPIPEPYVLGGLSAILSDVVVRHVYIVPRLLLFKHWSTCYIYVYYWDGEGEYWIEIEPEK